MSARRRLALVLAASLIIHAVLLGGLPSWKWTPRNLNPSMTVVLAPVAKKEEPPAPPVEPDRPAPPERSRVESEPNPAPAASPAAPAAPEPPGPQNEVVEPPALAPIPGPGALPVKPPAAPQPEVQLAPPEPVPPTPPAHAATAAPLVPPGSATLNYKVLGTEEKKNPPTLYHGEGTIVWKTLGREYHLALQARLSIVFISLSVLSSHSEGEIDPTGLVPRRYTETPRNKATLSVNYNRDERKSITFSASTATLPLIRGIQDRLSVLFQLGAIVRESATRQVTGGTVEIDVASTRGEIDLWNFVVLGTETIESGAGEFHTLHLKRTPRQRDGEVSYEQALDIWIAIGEGVEPYPVKIRFTEPNTNRYELTLDSIE